MKHPNAKQPAPAEEVETGSARLEHGEVSGLKKDWDGCSYDDIRADVFDPIVVAIQCPVDGCKYYARMKIQDGIHGYEPETVRSLAQMMRSHCDSGPKHHSDRTVHAHIRITA